MFVDSHCHLDFPELAAELPSLLDAMAAARVTHALCISVNLPDWPAVHALAIAHANLYATVGVHPDYADISKPLRDYPAWPDLPRAQKEGPENPQIIEVTREKKVVWTLKDQKNFGNSLAAWQLLDVEGKVIR